jgi:hypothetical protein
MSSFLEKLFQQIPEVFYDLVGRILPGGIVVATATKVHGIAIGTDSGFLELVLFTLLAYPSGLAISAFAHLIHLLSWYVTKPILEWSQISKRLMTDLKTITSDQDITLTWNPLRGAAILDRVHDFIKQRSPVARPVVTKLFAEVSLLYGVAISTAIACVSIEGYGKFWLFPAAFLLAGLIRSLRTWFRHQSILNAIINTPKTGS